MTENLSRPPLTILFQPSNGVGLGHVSRHIAIAQAVLKKAPSARVVFLTEGDSHSLLRAASLPYISLPDQNDLNVSWGGWSKAERGRMVLDLADTIIRRLSPHLILFDLIPCWAVVQTGIGREVPMALVVRKSKDMPNYFARLKDIQEYLSLILIPHAPNEIEIPSHLAEKTRFVGQIMRSYVDIAGNIDPIQRDKKIVICGGGGGYPNTVEYYNWALRAFASIRSRNPKVIGVLITGPLFRDWWKLQIVDGIRVVPHDLNLMATFASADLVICQAGYNTIAEITYLGVPTICVPADRVFDDQYERASQISNSSPNFHACPVLDADRLIQLIDHCLLQPSTPRPVTRAVAEGASLAADALLEIAEEYAHKRSI